MAFFFKRLLLFISSFICFGFNYLIAQTDPKIDSLNKIIQNTKADSIKVKTMVKLAIYYCRVGNNDKAIETAQKALERATTCNYKKGERNAYFTLGNIYLSAGNLDLATKNYIKALVLYETQHDSNHIGDIYNNLGSIYSNQRNYELAIHYYKRSFTVQQVKKNKEGMAHPLHNIGGIYCLKKDYINARKFSLQSLQLFKETGDVYGITECYLLLGQCAELEKKTEEALLYYKRALVISDSVSYIQNKVAALINISQVLNASDRSKEAISFVQEALILSEKHDIKSNIEQLYCALIKTYEAAGKWHEAFKYQKLLIGFCDSIYDVGIAEKTAEILEKYNSVKHEKNILQLEKEKAINIGLAEKRKLLAIIAIATGLLVITLLLLLLFRNKSLKKQKEIEFEKSKLQLEQQALRAQMNPHFVFNAINSIQKYILKQQPQEAYDYLSKFAKLIRMVLNNSQDFFLILDTELEMIKLHIELEQLRFNHIFVFNLTISEDVDTHEIKVPAMLIQPYVENAITHGLMNLENERAGILTITMTKRSEILNIVIEDNGIGRERSKKYKQEDNHKSLSMALTEQRLLMINKMKQYENAEITITDLYDEHKIACGTKVEIMLPIMYLKEPK